MVSTTKRSDQPSVAGIRRRTRLLIAIAITSACLAVITALGLVVIFVPRLQAEQIDKGLTPEQAARISPLERAKQINEYRRTLNETLASVGIGVFTLLGLCYFKRRDIVSRQQEREHEREKQREAQYQKAIDQLGSPAEATRVGAINTLEHLMGESPERHWAIVTVLNAFVRQRTLRSGDISRVSQQETMEPCPTDVQQAMRVLGTRPRRDEPARLNFSRCSLVNVDLVDGNFEGADFRGADLRGARFTLRNLHDANLEGALVRLIDARSWRAERVRHEFRNEPVAAAPDRDESRRTMSARREEEDILGPSNAVAEFMLAQRRWEEANRPRETSKSSMPAPNRPAGDPGACGWGAGDPVWPAESSGPLDSSL